MTQSTRGLSCVPLFLRTPTWSKPSACLSPGPRRGDHVSIRTLGWLVHVHFFITSSNNVKCLFIYILHLRLFRSYLAPNLSYLGPDPRLFKRRAEHHPRLPHRHCSACAQGRLGDSKFFLRGGFHRCMEGARAGAGSVVKLLHYPRHSVSHYKVRKTG